MPTEHNMSLEHNNCCDEEPYKGQPERLKDGIQEKKADKYQ